MLLPHVEKSCHFATMFLREKMSRLSSPRRCPLNNVLPDQNSRRLAQTHLFTNKVAREAAGHVHIEVPPPSDSKMSSR